MKPSCPYCKTALRTSAFALALGLLLYLFPITLHAQAPTTQPRQSPYSPAAIADLQRQAQAGDASAQMRLGLSYEHGLGVRRDLVQAIAWFQKSAAQGNANGEYYLGMMYRYGSGVQKDFAQAIALFQQAAEQGHADAENDLGTMYQNGEGVQQDYGQAMGWYQKAAAQGNIFAENNLGVVYQNGLGVRKDNAQAFLWYQRAAAYGYPAAENNLGVMYQNGWGVKPNAVQAVFWYQKAAEQGNANAETNLGWMYANSMGVQQDYGQAVAWYQKAAAQGDANGEANLGWMYDKGLGIQKDDAQALAWYQKAAAQGNSFAKTSLDALNQRIASAPAANATTAVAKTDSGNASVENECDLSKDPTDGIAVFSGTLPPEFLWFNYTLHLPTGKKKGIAVGQGISDFKDAFGRLFVLKLPAGDYEFPTWQYQLQNSTATVHPLHIHPLTFSVQSGRAVYLGGFDPIAFQRKQGFFNAKLDEAWVLVRDDHTRDLPALANKCPGFDPNLLDVKVMDTTPWLPPKKK